MDQVYCWGIRSIIEFVNYTNVYVGYSVISLGVLTAKLVDVRLLLRIALLTGSTNMILCHNHPSGCQEQSQADLNLTVKIKKAAEVMDIRVLDHLILTDREYFSFVDAGKM